jgi:D-inositol-3-phosphate glycosyltransferase
MICLTELINLRRRDRNPASMVGSATSCEDFLYALLHYNDLDLALLLGRDQLGWAQRMFSDIEIPKQLHLQPMEAAGEFFQSQDITALHRFSLDIRSAVYLRNQCPDKVIPVTGLVHGMSQPYLLWDAFSWLWLADLKPCDSIICTSQAARTAFLNQAAHAREGLRELGFIPLSSDIRTDVIPLAVDTGIFYPRDKQESRAALELPLEKKLILIFGRISYSTKANLEPFLVVLRRLNALHADIEVVLAGSVQDDELRIVQGSLERHGIQNVTIRRSPPIEQVPLYYSAADFTVCLSDTLQESFGLTPIEAMACGSPVVAPDWSGYRESIRPGETGFLVKTYWSACDRYINAFSMLRTWTEDHLLLSSSVAFDIEEMFHCCRVLLEDTELCQRMGAEAARYAHERYNLKSLAESYADLATELKGIGGGIPGSAPARNPFRVLTPDYYRSFGHFASAALSGDTVVAKAEEMPVEVGRSFIPYIPYADGDFALALIAAVGNTPNGATTIQELHQEMSHHFFMDETVLLYQVSSSRPEYDFSGWLSLARVTPCENRYLAGT